MDPLLLRDLGIALGLGFLIGLQREWAKKRIAGIRTFPLIALFGALCGIWTESGGNVWIVPAGLLAVAALFAVAYHRHSVEVDGPGATTEFAGLVMFVIGSLVSTGQLAVAIVATGVVAVLLHWKEPLHRVAERIGADDFRALVRLVIIGMVILPVLPDESFGPFDVLNPFRIWLIVVLIVGISMAAYVVQRLVGAKTGTLLSGVLGGLISSTATTVSYARQAGASQSQSQSGAAAVVIMLASTVVFGRVLFEVWVVAPAIMPSVAPPIVAMMAIMLVISAAGYWRLRSEVQPVQQDGPSSDLLAAVIFGLLYAGVLLAVAAAKQYLGAAGLYIVAALSGMTDMDAITLSSAEFMRSGSIEYATGWRLILVGAMANLVFKAGVVAALGSRDLLRRVLVMFGLSIAGGAALLVLWPG